MFFQVMNHKVAITISSFNWIQNVRLASLWLSIVPLTQMNWKHATYYKIRQKLP